jgi:hypothetical protein
MIIVNLDKTIRLAMLAPLNRIVTSAHYHKKTNTKKVVVGGRLEIDRESLLLSIQLIWPNKTIII